MPKKPSNGAGPGPLPEDTGLPVRGMAGFDVGLRLLVSVLGLGALGFALDRYTGTLPLFMLLGGVAGFGGWMVSVIRRKR
jgi:hypothetical protein